MGDTFKKHITLVSEILGTLLQHGVKIKTGKCKWAVSSVQFLGQVVSSTGVLKTKKVVEKVSNFPLPETIQQLREFL